MDIHVRFEKPYRFSHDGHSNKLYQKGDELTVDHRIAHSTILHPSAGGVATQIKERTSAPEAPETQPSQEPDRGSLPDAQSIAEVEEQEQEKEEQEIAKELEDEAKQEKIDLENKQGQEPKIVDPKKETETIKSTKLKQKK